MRRLPRYLAYGFAIVACVVVPLATVPLTLSLDPVVVFYAPKLALSIVAIILAWGAILVQNSKRSLVATGLIAFVNGLNKWVSVLMVLVVIAATVTGDDLWTSMMGSSGRLDGAIVVVTLLHLMQMAHALVRQRLVNVRNVVSLAITGGTLVSLVLLMEKSGTHAWGLVTPSISPIANPISTVGNIGALTNLLSVVFVLAVMSTVTLRGRRMWLHWGAAVVLASGIAVHVGRAGVSAAMIALSFAAVIVLLRRHPRVSSPLVGMSILLSTIFIGTTLSNWTAERSQLFSALTPGASPDLNLQHRYITWQAGLRSIINNPLFGTGTGSFVDQVWLHASPEQELVLYTAFIPERLVARATRSGRIITVFDDETQTLLIRNAAYDKVHNYFLDFGVAYGAIALFAMLVLWSVLALAGWRCFEARPELLTAIVAYLAALQFWFLSINVDPALYVAFGALASNFPTRATGQAKTTFDEGSSISSGEGTAQSSR